MAIFKYTKVITGEWPNDTTLSFRFNNLPDSVNPIELAEVNGINYVFVPDTIVDQIPDQDPLIEFTAVLMTDVLKDQIKQNSVIVRLLNEQFNNKLRGQYSLDDEQYFSRIGIGVALGIYQFQLGEEQALLDFGTFVENLRTAKRTNLTNIGL